MALVNPLLSPIVYHTASTPTSASNGGAPATAGLGVSVGVGSAGIKDSRWLTLDVCREFTRNKCSRSDDECRFAHPPPNVEVQNGRVMCCFDSIKGKCQRRDPPCKYLHPPQHLKEQLLQNGRNNLILRHLQMQMMASSIPGIYPVLYDLNTGKSFPAATSYFPLQGHESYVMPRYLLPTASACYSPFYTTATPAPYAISNSASSSIYPQSASNASAVSAGNDVSMTSQHLVMVGDQLNDRNEIGSNSVTSCTTANGGVIPMQCASPLWQNGPPPSAGSPNVTNGGATIVDGANYTSPPTAAVYFQTPNGAATVAGVMPVIKPSLPSEQMGKCATNGVPFYQPAAIAYQQMTMAAMQLQQPATYVPIPIAGQATFEPAARY